MAANLSPQSNLQPFQTSKNNLPAKGMAAALFLLYVLFLNPHLDLVGFNANDPAAYLDRIFAILKGIGYGELYADGFFPVTLQPPALSFLLTPFVGIFGMNFVVLKLVMVGLALLFAWTSFHFFNYFLPYEKRQAAPFLTLLLMAHPAVFGLSHVIMAEIPLMTAMAAGLLFLDCYLKTPGQFFGSRLWLAAGAVSLAYFFKETGMAVLLAGGFLFLHPRYFKKEIFLKLVLTAALIAIPVFLWKWYCGQVHSPDNFWSQSGGINFFYKNPYEVGDATRMTLSDFVSRMRQNIVWGMAGNMGMLAIPFFYFDQGSLTSFILSVPLIILLGIQMMRSWIKEPSLLEGFVLVMIVVLFPKIEGMALRHIVPLYGAFLIYAVRGVQKSGRFLWILVFAMAFTSTLRAAVQQAQNPYGSKIAADYVETAQKAKALWPKESLCVVPSASHWQVLTEHLCYIKEEKMAPAYYVALADSAGPVPPKDFPKTLFESAAKIREKIQSRQDLQKIYGNDSFVILKTGQSGS